MKIEDLVDLLISDLSREYMHWHFYMQAATSVRGLHRQEISEFFLEQANSEMKHVEEFRRMIQGIITRRKLNKSVPNVVADFQKDLTCPVDLLKFALKMEDEVVSNYVERLSQSESIQDNNPEDRDDGKYVELFLEDQIIDSRSDADNIREMLETSIDKKI